MVMISRAEIENFVKQVVLRFQPDAVILFGSYAYGSPTGDSDVDLMVVMPYRGPAPAAASRIRLACPRGFPMDLIVRTPSEVRRRMQMGDQFVREVLSKGIVLYESRNARMGRKGRSGLRGGADVAAIAKEI
jgi:predicted nucleotidyltransferase